MVNILKEENLEFGKDNQIISISINKLLIHNKSENSIIIYSTKLKKELKKINLKTLNLKIHKIFLINAETLLNSHNSYDLKKNEKSKNQKINDFLLIQSDKGLIKYNIFQKSIEYLIKKENSQKNFSLIKIINPNLLIKEDYKGNFQFYDLKKNNLSNPILNFHKKKLLSIQKKLTSLDNLPLIYTICEDKLFCWNLHDLSTPFIEFEILKKKKDNFFKLFVCEYFDLLILFGYKGLFIYSAFNKKLLFFLEFEEFREIQKIRFVCKLYENDFCLKFLICDYDFRFYFIDLKEFPFLNFDLDSFKLKIDETHFIISLKNNFLEHFKGFKKLEKIYYSDDSLYFLETSNSCLKRDKNFVFRCFKKREYNFL